MSSQVDKLNNLLSSFHAKTSAATENLCTRSFDAMQRGVFPEAISLAQAALRDGTSRNDRNSQAIASAHLAAAHARQQNFVDALKQAKECQRLFKQIGDLHNRAFAKALMATIYRMYIETLSTELLRTLEEGQFDAKHLKEKSLSKGDIWQAAIYYNQFVEFGNSLRRARWIPPIAHAFPLQWVPVIDEMPPDPRLQSPRIVGYMEPVVVITHTLDRAGYPRSNLFMLNRTDLGRSISQTDSDQLISALYAAYHKPRVGGLASDLLLPASLAADVVYIAIRVDPRSAQLAGYRDGDYLLVRSADSGEADRQPPDGEQAGWSFELDEEGRVTFFTAVSPKFVGEPRVKMFDLQIDAILRRIR